MRQGDIILVNLNPTKGHEQGNYRPAMIIDRDDVPLPSNLHIVDQCCDIAVQLIKA